LERNAYKIFVEKPELKVPHGRLELISVWLATKKCFLFFAVGLYGKEKNKTTYARIT